MGIKTVATVALSLLVCLPAMAEEAAEKAAAPAAQPVLTLGALDFVDNGKVGIAIASDGTMTANRRDQSGTVTKTVMGTFSTDGKFTSKDGKTTISISTDGVITGPDGVALPGKIGANHEYTRDGKTLSINDDGTLAVDGQTHSGDDKIVGVTAETKRLAMFATVLIITMAEPDEAVHGSKASPAKVKAPAAPAAPASAPAAAPATAK